MQVRDEEITGQKNIDNLRKSVEANLTKDPGLLDIWKAKEYKNKILLQMIAMGDAFLGQ